MRSILTAVSILLLSSANLLGQQSDSQSNSKLPPAKAMLSSALCGKGTFLISLAGSSIGLETTEVKCVENGFQIVAQTNLKIPGAPVDVHTDYEIDKSGAPIRFVSKGSLAQKPLDQEITFKDGKATITTKDGAQEMAFQPGASFVMSNTPYMIALIAARYDVSRGGAQQIPVFPNMSATVERTARDEVQPIGSLAGPKPTAFDRYLMNVGQGTLVVWADMQGRIAVISVPMQKFVSVRDEYSSFAEPLSAALVSSMKELRPDYSAPKDAPFTAEEVKIKVKNFVLAGTLLVPKTGTRPFPAVITSTGSGQQTRDEPIPYPNLKEFKPFRQIAEYLAARGIAVLRVDDRGVGDSTGLETLEQATTFDFADDVRAQVAYLRTRSEIDPARISIVGHSEGGIIAPLVAASDPKIAAIVLLAGTGKRGDEVLLYQMNRPLELNAAMPEAEKAKERAANRAIIQTVIDGGDTSKLPTIFHFRWTKVFLTYDPLATIRKVRSPILIMQGALDQQVTQDQAELIASSARAAGNKQVMVQIFPTLNHFFLPSKSGDESEYSSLEATSLGEDVLKTMGDWLLFKLQRSDPAPVKAR